MNIIELMKRVNLFPKGTPHVVRDVIKEAEKAFDNFEYEKAIKFFGRARRMKKCPDSLKPWLDYLIQSLKKKVKEINK